MKTDPDYEKLSPEQKKLVDEIAAEIKGLNSIERIGAGALVINEFLLASARHTKAPQETLSDVSDLSVRLMIGLTAVDVITTLLKRSTKVGPARALLEVGLEAANTTKELGPIRLQLMNIMEMVKDQYKETRDENPPASS